MVNTGGLVLVKKLVVARMLVLVVAEVVATTEKGKVAAGKVAEGVAKVDQVGSVVLGSVGRTVGALG